jgi:hypothetical protein
MVGNHATVIVAADFLVVTTAAFRNLYVFVVIETGSGGSSRRACSLAASTLPTDRKSYQTSDSYGGVSPSLIVKYCLRT